MKVVSAEERRRRAHERRYAGGVSDTPAPTPPAYLRACLVCGEWHNRARRILCLCDRLVCAVCGEGRIRRPISDHYDEEAGRVWHTPWLAGLRPCPNCGAAGHRAWASRAAA